MIEKTEETNKTTLPINLLYVKILLRCPLTHTSLVIDQHHWIQYSCVKNTYNAIFIPFIGKCQRDGPMKPAHKRLNM